MRKPLSNLELVSKGFQNNIIPETHNWEKFSLTKTWTNANKLVHTRNINKNLEQKLWMLFHMQQLPSNIFLLTISTISSERPQLADSFWTQSLWHLNLKLNISAFTNLCYQSTGVKRVIRQRTSHLYNWDWIRSMYSIRMGAHAWMYTVLECSQNPAVYSVYDILVWNVTCK